MTNEDKQLLTQDLCARIPYGVMCNQGGLIRKLISVDNLGGFPICLDNDNYFSQNYSVKDVKPYLRSMDDMTEDEKKEYYSILYNAVSIPGREYDFYNSHHFDYRGLI